MTKQKPIPDILLERLILGELSPEQEADVRRRLEAEPDGAQRLAALQADNEKILKVYPPRQTAAIVSKLYEDQSELKVEKQSRWRWRPAYTILTGFVTVSLVLVSVATFIFVTEGSSHLPFIYAVFDGGGGGAPSASKAKRTVEPDVLDFMRDLPDRSDKLPKTVEPENSMILPESLELEQEPLIALATRRGSTGHDRNGVKLVRRFGREDPNSIGSTIPERRHAQEGFNTESYDRIYENDFLNAKDDPLSTFSIDVDTASYANVRRILNGGQLPPRGAVRIEEMINYFTYDYPQPEKGAPFSVNTEIAACPWNPDHRLVRIGLKGEEMALEKRPPSNLVFLLDVSGSMSDDNKLPLVKKAFKLLVKQLGNNDSVAIVVYAGSSGLVLPATICESKTKILDALARLSAGGSTNAGDGIELAYRIAEENFVGGGNNRVILATDGDFNVGVTNQSELTRLIEDKAKSGIFLTALGFGMGNYKDATLETLADKGNGNYAYIDTFKEARKVFVEQLTGTLYTIAKDVKIQVEFNPGEVKAYRLLGYENRMLAAKDFNDDKKDAGEIGAGHTVTALYQIVPVGKEIGVTEGSIDELKYQQPKTLSGAAKSSELLTVKLRYKEPDGDTSKLLEYPIVDSGRRFDMASADFRFAAAVASFGMLLRDSEYKFGSNYDAVIEIAGSAKGEDELGYRKEFVDLVRAARDLQRRD